MLVHFRAIPKLFLILMIGVLVLTFQCQANLLKGWLDVKDFIKILGGQDNLIKTIAESLIIRGVKGLLKYNQGNSWQEQEAQDYVLDSMGYKNDNEDFRIEEIRNALSPFAIRIVKQFGKSTEIDIQYAIEVNKKYVEDKLKSLYLDPEELLARHEQISFSSKKMPSKIQVHNGKPYVLFLVKSSQSNSLRCYSGTAPIETEFEKKNKNIIRGCDFVVTGQPGKEKIVTSYVVRRWYERGAWNNPVHKGVNVEKEFLYVDNKEFATTCHTDGGEGRALREKPGIYESVVAVDQDGKVHIIHNVTKVSNSYKVSSNLYYNNRNLLSFRQVPENRYCYPGIAVDSNNQVHKVFYNPDENVIWYAGPQVRVEVGSPQRPPETGTLNSGSYFAVDSSGNAHFLYIDKQTKTPIYNCFDNERREWVLPRPGIQVYSMGPMILDAHDRPYILYQDIEENGGFLTIGILLRKEGETYWASVPLKQITGLQSASFDMDGEGHIHISYSPKAGGLYYARTNFAFPHLADLLQKKIADEDESDPNESETSDPEILSTYSLHFNQGINMLAVPLDPGEPWKITDLVNFIGEDDVKTVIWYDTEISRFKSYIQDIPTSNTPQIQGGQGYIVYMKVPKSVEFRGTAWERTPISATPQFWGRVGEHVSLAAWEQLSRLLKEAGVFGPPVTSVLLPNFPNPFNPDTWIPYCLHDDSQVHINIYDTKGELIRTLNLGFQEAGYYLTKQRAAYWDGRNNTQEKVASGIYYYTLQTANYQATRKMLILK